MTTGAVALCLPSLPDGGEWFAGSAVFICEQRCGQIIGHPHFFEFTATESDLAELVIELDIGLGINMAFLHGPCALCVRDGNCLFVSLTD